MIQDKRTTMSTDMNEDVDLMRDDDMTDQELDALRREIADANRREKLRLKPSM